MWNRGFSDDVAKHHGRGQEKRPAGDYRERLRGDATPCDPSKCFDVETRDSKRHSLLVKKKVFQTSRHKDVRRYPLDCTLLYMRKNGRLVSLRFGLQGGRSHRQSKFIQGCHGRHHRARDPGGGNLGLTRWPCPSTESRRGGSDGFAEPEDDSKPHGDFSNMGGFHAEQVRYDRCGNGA